jgi:hypothetical protein
MRHSSTVIKHLKDDYDVNQVPVLYWYFNFRDPSTESCENFIRSLLYQFIHYLPYVPPEVRQLYSRNASGRPSTEEMTTCLIALIRREKEVRLLGDAFDECTQWNILWKFLTKMAKCECPSLRLLFTSRPEREIEEAVNSLGIPSLDLRTVMDEDIKQFVVETLERSARPICRLPENAKDLIRESLVRRAGGMYAILFPPQCPYPDSHLFIRFRWVALQIDELCDCKTMSSLHHTLDSLPKTLDDTYRRILDKVHECNQPFVQHILQCVCFFFRPIFVEEVGHIYRIGDCRKPPFDCEDALFHPKDAVDLCSGLLCPVFVDNWLNLMLWGREGDVTETVQLAHFSVKEYLLSARAMSWRLNEELSHLYIVKASIAYYLEFMASEDATSPEYTLDGSKIHSLAFYCARYTSRHLSHLHPRDHPDLTESFQYLLDPTLQSNPDRKIGPRHFDKVFRNLPPSINDAETLKVLTLRTAACLGLPMICQWLLSINTLAQISSPVTKTGIGSSFLSDAASYDHADVVKVLLKAGADIDGYRWDYAPALHYAVQSGSKEIVEILVNSGADPNIEFARLTAMDRAIASENEEIVKILQDAGGISYREL